MIVDPEGYMVTNAHVVNGAQNIEVIVPPLCNVPSGAFTMGSDKQHDPQANDNELPQYDIFVPTFQIGLYPLTVAEQARTAKAGKRKGPGAAGEVTGPAEHPDTTHPP